MPDLSLFVTGGTGFIGRRLLERLAAEGSYRVTCLTRHSPATAGVPAGINVVTGDLRDPATFADALRGSDVVIHLAAATGKALPAEYGAVNDAGTRTLMAACRQAGVPRVIFVSSIAATFRDKTVHYYALSKERAEQAVRRSGLNYAIVRPTIVLGKGSPILARLVALASLPVTPVVGDGSARVQPVHVDDVATFLLSMLASELPDRAIDLGGPDIVTFEELMGRIRTRLRGRAVPVVHLPARSTIGLLRWIERWLPSVLPITAGQLSAFVNDSVSVDAPPERYKVPEMKTIDEMVRLLVGHA